MPPNTDSDQFFRYLDYNAYFQTDGATRGLIHWQRMNGAAVSYKSLREFTAAKGFESHGTAVTGAAPDPFFTSAATKNFVVRSSSSAYRSGRALPADVAAALGIPAGTVVNRGAISWPGHRMA